MAAAKVESNALTSLIIIQIMLRELPGEQSMFDFVCRGLLDIPGVKSAERSECGAEDCNEGGCCFPVSIAGSNYGCLSVTLSNKDEFYPYQAYVGNLAFMMAAVINEKRSRKLAEDQQKELERQVADRTSKLRTAEKAAVEARKLAEDYLRVSEAMIVELDADARVVVVNDRACALLGYKRDELIGKDWIELVIPEELRPEMHAVFSGVIEGEEGVEYFDNEVLCKNGDRLSISWHNVNLQDEDGNVCGTLSSGIDITSRIKLEELSQRTERLESMGILAGGVAHDLNNLLGPLVGLPQMIIEDLENDTGMADETKSEMKECLNLIERCANRATGVVKDLLTLGRRHRYDLKCIDITACVRDCVDQQREDYLVNSERSVSVNLKAPDVPLMVLGEGSALLRVEGNLLRNAVEAVSGPGKVDVTVSAVQLDDQYLGNEIVPPGRYAIVSVADTGPGIPGHDLARIFEPFFSRKIKNDRSGSGLGLSVVHGIVKDHLGYIDVRTRKDEGTVFELYFPLDDKGGIEEQQGFAGPVEGKGRVLVVDDENSQRYMARKLLVKAGYTVAEAVSGSEALNLFRVAHEKDMPCPYDVLVMDMIMEESFDGLDAMKAIRELYPYVPVLIASGHAPNDRSAAAVRMGAKWLQKPYKRSSFLLEVAEAMKR